MKPRLSQSARSAGGLRLSITAAAGRSFVPFLRRRLREARRLMKSQLQELSVALVGDGKMSELHERFMGLAGPTDVLTFPLEHDARGRCVAGEVIVCATEARRQAKARGIAAENEVLLYAIHGMLHLSGFDDRTAADYRTMHRTEDRILRKLGVGAVFDRAVGKNSAIAVGKNAAIAAGKDAAIAAGKNAAMAAGKRRRQAGGR